MSGVNVPQRVVPYSPFVPPGLDRDLPEADLRDYGAPDASGDATVAWHAAAADTEPKTLKIAGFIYTIEEQAPFTGDRINIVGMGRQVTWLRFMPSSDDQACVYFKGDILDDAMIYPSLRDLSIMSDDTTFRKFAIRSDVCTGMAIERVTVYPFEGGPALSPFVGGGSSSALYMRGWEQQCIKHCELSGDIPIRIGTNPNDPNIAIDLTSFENVLTHGGVGNPNVWIEAGVHLTRTRFQLVDFVGGKYGLYWVDPVNNGTSSGLTFDQVSAEQLEAGGREILISLTSKMQSVHIVGGTGGSTNGIYLRNCDFVTIDNWFYGGAAKEALNVDTSCNRVRIRNTFMQATSTVSLGGMTTAEGDGHESTLSPLPYDCLLTASTASGRAHKDGDIYKPIPKKVTLANGATTPVDTFSGSISRAHVTVMFTGATKWGKFSVYYDNLRAVLAGTTDTAAGTTWTGIGNVPGRITVFWQSAATVSVWNQLGESVEVTVEISIV